MNYIKRINDTDVKKRLKRAGAVLIEGAKACGKTELARQIATSEINIDTDKSVPSAMQFDPNILLAGEKPRLLDEWHVQPRLWNYIRHAVDDGRSVGAFILTGSANPVEDLNLHSGTGRFSTLQMRTMSWQETGWSDATVSMQDLLGGKKVVTRPIVNISIQDIALRICRGGWPLPLAHKFSDEDAILYTRDYVNTLADVDISRVNGAPRHNAVMIRRCLRSIARNIATEVSIATIQKDMEYDGGETVDRDTISAYLNTLNRLFILEDLPAWSANIRSSVPLRKSPKRHFVDPSIATGVLALDVEALVADLHYLGFLFESEVIRDLRIYAEANDAKVLFYRDGSGKEIDAIIEKSNGEFAAFEVKLGFEAEVEAAENLLEFADLLVGKKPVSLNVITGNGFAHTRDDGVNVIPLANLGV
jgi:predicted AAA+ superfamily ATPase